MAAPDQRADAPQHQRGDRHRGAGPEAAAGIGVDPQAHHEGEPDPAGHRRPRHHPEHRGGARPRVTEQGLADGIGEAPDHQAPDQGHQSEAGGQTEHDGSGALGGVGVGTHQAGRDRHPHPGVERVHRAEQDLGAPHLGHLVEAGDGPEEQHHHLGRPVEEHELGGVAQAQAGVVGDPAASAGEAGHHSELERTDDGGDGTGRAPRGEEPTHGVEGGLGQGDDGEGGPAAPDGVVDRGRPGEVLGEEGEAPEVLEEQSRQDEPEHRQELADGAGHHLRPARAQRNPRAAPKASAEPAASASIERRCSPSAAL